MKKTTKKKSGKRESSGMMFTALQLRFIEAMELDPDAKQAALKAGVKECSASQMATRWLNMKGQFSHVALEVRKRLLKKIQLAQFSADDTLRLIQQGAFLSAPHWFEPGSLQDDSWTIKEEDYRELPIEVMRQIKSAQKEIKFTESGEEIYTGWLRIRLIDKMEMIRLCAKHMLIVDSNVGTTTVQINWNQLLTVAEQAGKGIAQEAQQNRAALPNQSAVNNPTSAIEDRVQAPQQIIIQQRKEATLPDQSSVSNNGTTIVDQSFLEQKLLALVQSVNRELLEKQNSPKSSSTDQSSATEQARAEQEPNP